MRQLDTKKENYWGHYMLRCSRSHVDTRLLLGGEVFWRWCVRPLLCLLFVALVSWASFANAGGLFGTEEESREVDYTVAYDPPSVDHSAVPSSILQKPVPSNNVSSDWSLIDAESDTDSFELLSDMPISNNALNDEKNTPALASTPTPSESLSESHDSGKKMSLRNEENGGAQIEPWIDSESVMTSFFTPDSLSTSARSPLFLPHSRTTGDMDGAFAMKEGYDILCKNNDGNMQKSPQLQRRASSGDVENLFISVASRGSRDNISMSSERAIIVPDALTNDDVKSQQAPVLNEALKDNISMSSKRDFIVSDDSTYDDEASLKSLVMDAEVQDNISMSSKRDFIVSDDSMYDDEASLKSLVMDAEVQDNLLMSSEHAINVPDALTSDGKASLKVSVLNEEGDVGAEVNRFVGAKKRLIAPLNASVQAGATVSVDLGSEGEDFNDVAVRVSPETAGKVIMENISNANNSSYRLFFTASSNYVGPAEIDYTLKHADGTSLSNTVTVIVSKRVEDTNRMDISKDSEVIGLLAAQATSVKRFATSQLSNFSRRLESLHGDGWGRSTFGISVSSRTESNVSKSDSASLQPRGVGDRVMSSPMQPFLRKTGGARQGAGTHGTTLAKNNAEVLGYGLPELATQEDGGKQALSLWMGGAVDFGQHAANGQRGEFKFTTNGVSAGGDYRMNDLVSIGVGAGFARDSSDIGSRGTKSSAQNVVAALYGSVRPMRGVFIDGVLGYGTLDFDTKRYITNVGDFATGSRSGRQIFGSLSTGIEYRGNGWLVSPYGRVEMMSASLDQFTEKASGQNALTYYKQKVRTTDGIVGLRAEGSHKTRIGTLGPRARVEYRRSFDGTHDANLAYADLAAAGPAYVVRTNARNAGHWNVGLGAKLEVSGGTSFTLDYNTTIDMRNGRSQSVMLGVAVPM